MLYTAATFKMVFDYHSDDVYWCTADIGWITGHSYITYGPLANGATSVLVRGTTNKHFLCPILHYTPCYHFLLVNNIMTHLHRHLLLSSVSSLRVFPHTRMWAECGRLLINITSPSSTQHPLPSGSWWSTAASPFRSTFVVYCVCPRFSTLERGFPQSWRIC